MSAIVRNSLIVLGGRWIDRALGFASTLALARLLVPDDFGLVAMAWMVIGLLDTCLDFGVGVQMIQKRDADPDFYHTGFTLRLLQSSVLCALVVASAPFAAAYFREPRLEAVLYVLAPSIVLNAGISIGMLIRQKEMAFHFEVGLAIVRKVAQVGVTAAAAWLLASYWALVIGNYTGAVVSVALSYLMHPYRPRLTLSRAREMWRHSTALFVRSLAGAVAINMDRFALGRLHSTAAVGTYQLADEIASMPSTELIAPINRIFLPAFSAAQDRPERMQHLFVRALSVGTCVALPAGTGLSLLAPAAVHVLLGPKWDEAAPLLRVLAWCGVFGAIASTCNAMAYAQGRFLGVAVVTVVQIAGFALACGGLVAWAGGSTPTLIALAKSGSMLGCAAFCYGLAARGLPRGTTARLAGSVWRIVLATAAMAAALRGLDGWWTASPSLATLLEAVAAGALVYAAALGAAWWSCGRPDGPEAFFVERLALPALRRVGIGRRRGLDASGGSAER